MKQLFYKEHLIENESVRIAENLEKSDTSHSKK